MPLGILEVLGSGPGLPWVPPPTVLAAWLPNRGSQLVSSTVPVHTDPRTVGILAVWTRDDSLFWDPVVVAI